MTDFLVYLYIANLMIITWTIGKESFFAGVAFMALMSAVTLAIMGGGAMGKISLLIN